MLGDWFSNFMWRKNTSNSLTILIASTAVFRAKKISYLGIKTRAILGSLLE